MVTGEKDNQWGDITNTNLNLVQQAIAGFESIAITSTNTTLLMTDGQISPARNAVLRFTGAITANCTVFVASGIEKTYTVDNATTGAFTVALNQAGGNSVIFEATNKSHKLVYLDGTNANDILDDLSTIRLPNQNEVRFGDADNSNYVALKAGTTIASNISFTLPTADGTSGQAILTDGAGALSFGAAGISTGKAIAMAIVFG
jgi:glycine cleavage system aminomethyltransferase T